VKTVLDTRQRILDTAADLIWARSYGTVSMDDICERAKVNKGSLYHYFASKSDLAIAVFDEHWRAAEIELKHAFSQENSPLSRFDRFCDYVVQRQVTRSGRIGIVCGCPHDTVGSELGTQDQNIRAKVAEILTNKQLYFESALRDLVAEGLLTEEEIPTVARHIQAYVMGTLSLARIENDLAILHDLKKGIARILGVAALTVVA